MNKGIILAFLTAFQWGALGIFIKNIENMTTAGMVATRLLIGSFFLLLIIMSQKKTRKNLLKSFRSIKFYILISLLMSTHFMFSTMGFVYSTVANASLLTSTTPIFVSLFAFIFLSERISNKEFLGIVIAFSGILVIFSSKGLSLEGEYFQGNIYAVIAAILIAVYTIIISKNMKKHSPLITLFWISFMGSILIFIGCGLTNTPLLFKVTNNDILNLIGLTIVGTLGHVCYFMCLKYIKTTTASSITMGTPVVAIIYAMFFLSETYTASNLIGIFICMCGIALTVNNKAVVERKAVIN